MNKQQLFAIIGIAALVIDVISIIIIGALTPEYNHVRGLISELAPLSFELAVITTSIMIFTGLLLIVFAVGLYRALPKNAYTSVAVALLIFFAVFGCIGTAVFPCDPGCSGLSELTKLHYLSVSLGFALLLLSPGFMYIGIRGDETWEPLEPINLTTLFLGIITILLFLSNIQPIIGLLQKIFLAVYYVWIGAMAIELYILGVDS